MNDYNNSVIYKIFCKDDIIKDFYIGSSTQIKERRKCHKKRCNNGDNTPVYRFIRENGGWENWALEIIEKYKCNNKEELFNRERIYIEDLKSSLNINIPIFTEEEKKERKKESDKKYYQKNREIILEKVKKYTKENKDKKRIYDKKYTEENKDKISEKNKEYYIKNKEEMKDKMRESYIKNKDKRQLYNKQIINCPCGSVVCRGGLSQHKKSKKHQNWEKTQVE